VNGDAGLEIRCFWLTSPYHESRSAVATRVAAHQSSILFTPERYMLVFGGLKKFAYSHAKALRDPL
jgi:hypothetical protein